MKTKPLVSICCTTYNHESSIKDAIEGFLIQKTTFAIEIIIHDDASTDNTSYIIEKYAEKYPNLIVPILQKENQWSKGIRPSPTFVWPKAKGKYIALCEGDDYWTDPLKLQKQVAVLEKDQTYSLCFHNSRYLFMNKRSKEKLFCNLQTNHFDILDVIEKNWFIPTQSMMFRTKYLRDLPDFYSLTPNGDLALQFILALKGNIYYIDEVMSIYRKHKSGITSMSLYSDTQIKIIELLNYFNYYSNFQFNTEIQKRIKKTKKDLYRSSLYERPTFARILNFDFFYHKFKSLVKNTSIKKIRQ